MRLRIGTVALVGLLGLMTVPREAGGGISTVTPGLETTGNSARIQKLIGQLGNRDYFVRQKAQSELAKIGFEAYDALLDATTHEDLEIAARAKYLLRLIRVQWTLESDPPEVKQLLQDYEFKDPDERQRRMAALAGLPAAAGVPSLCRLVRFEQSEEYSKLAAVQILLLDRFDDDLQPQIAKTILKNLGNSRRVAAHWLVAYLRLREDPAAALSEWVRLVAAEQGLLRRAAGQTNPKIVSALLRIEIQTLQKLQRTDEAVAAMQRLIELERGNLDSLVELVEWLVDQKAWKLVDEVAARFATRFSANTLLMYLQAEAQLQRGDAKAAAETIRKARAFYVGNTEDVLFMHVFTANRLFRRGKYEWAEQEFRDVIAKGGSTNTWGVTAYAGLAEMFHDQAQDAKAAEALQAMLTQVGNDKPDDYLLADRAVGEYRAQWHYYRSCVCQQRGDLAQQRAELDRGLDAAPGDIDSLIAAYRLPNSTPEQRRKIQALVRKAGDDIREQIAANPPPQTADDARLCAIPFNQLAWLIANTEGDLDEALKFSKTSLELRPAEGGYYDTLARVCYARGDYANAVKYQTKAATLEPHYGLIARQLALFKKALAEHPKKSPSATPQPVSPTK